jgi:integrase
MALWEQRTAGVAASWKGWSITKDQRGRVMVLRRESGRPAEKVLLPRPIVWAEEYEDDIQNWAKQLWKTLDNDPDKTLRGALEDTAPKSDRHGEAFAVTWTDVEQSFKRTLMEEGNEIALKTYEASYLKFISVALKELATGRHSNGRDLLRACIAPWRDKYASRGYCIDAVSKFLLHAVTEHGYPGAWLISANDKKQLRGKKQVKQEKAVLSDQQILDLVAALEEKNPAWASVVRLLAATGIRAVECQYLVVKPNPTTGKDQLFSTYNKTGGKNPTKPRFLFPLPIKGDDGNVHLWDFTATFKTMQWPTNREGKRVEISGKTVGARLRDHTPMWNEWRAKIKEETGEWLRPYVFRDSWNVRADNLGIPIGVKCHAFGNTPETNSRAYRTSSDAATAKHFDAVYGGMP